MQKEPEATPHAGAAVMAAPTAVSVSTKQSTRHVDRLPDIATLNQSIFAKTDSEAYDIYYNDIFIHQTAGQVVYQAIMAKTGSQQNVS